MPCKEKILTNLQTAKKTTIIRKICWKLHVFILPNLVVKVLNQISLSLLTFAGIRYISISICVKYYSTLYLHKRHFLPISHNQCLKTFLQYTRIVKFLFWSNIRLVKVIRDEVFCLQSPGWVRFHLLFLSLVILTHKARAAFRLLPWSC